MKHQNPPLAEHLAHVLAQCDDIHYENELRGHCIDKTPVVLALLREHLPEKALQETEKLLSSHFGCECLRDELQLDRARMKLREILPVDRWEEIENWLQTEMFHMRNQRETGPLYRARSNFQPTIPF